MSQNKTLKIDFVITWVDGSDEKWPRSEPLPKVSLLSKNLDLTQAICVFATILIFSSIGFVALKNSPHGLIASSSSRPDIFQTG